LLGGSASVGNADGFGFISVFRLLLSWGFGFFGDAIVASSCSGGVCCDLRAVLGRSLDLLLLSVGFDNNLVAAVATRFWASPKRPTEAALLRTLGLLLLSFSLDFLRDAAVASSRFILLRLSAAGCRRGSVGR
jgi:hypothetical protein